MATAIENAKAGNTITIDGDITLKNGANVAIDYYKDLTITTDATSTFTGTEVM